MRVFHHLNVDWTHTVQDQSKLGLIYLLRDVLASVMVLNSEFYSLLVRWGHEPLDGV